ncbi:amidohydrolase family protein [Paenibacillus sp. IITD108]|uniref:amidohydrolase family protein n=1 Tax=Paenibacillus sp. IITD108 TaxID=3116649 RepID=UPI002F3EB5DC
MSDHLIETDSLAYFDCNAFVGQYGYKHHRQVWRTEDVVSEMERCGIAGAIVHHGLSRTHAPDYGNRRLAAELDKSPRLFGCWAVLPDHATDFASPAELIEALREHDIRAVTMFPRTHQFELDNRTVGALLTELERAQIPLFIQSDEISFAQLDGILDRHPHLSVLLLGCCWGQERRLFPLMDAYPRLGIDLSSLQSNRIIETLYQRYGAERIFYGSGMPYKSPGAARAMIDYADIPYRAKQLIAGENLSKLLGIKPPTAVFQADAITFQAAKGVAIDAVNVLDSHTHLIEDGGRTGSGLPMLGGDIDAMMAMYRRLGIRSMSIAPWAGINGGDAAAGNVIAEQARSRYPQEVNCYAVIDPNYTRDVAAEARKWHLEKQFAGMKPYYYLSHTAYTDPVYKPWWELANERHLYALVDPALIADQQYVEWIDELATCYPQVQIFMDHAGRSFEIADLYAEVALRHDNVTLQLTYTSVPLGVIEYLTEQVGARKILFGTDSPMRDPRPQLGWLAYANLSLEDKRQLFGDNFRRILQRCKLK